jgi:hypothetical protein
MQRLATLSLTLALLAASASAQTYQRRATFRSSDRPDRGKCTIEVVVDGAAEVEVRGDTAALRNLNGQPPQWRRFECTAPLPPNPADFRFAGVDGRGRQTLVRDPRSGGSAVIRIEDPQNGSEGYTFDLFWSANGQQGRGDDRGFGGDRGGDRDRGGFDRDRDRGGDVFYRDRDAWFRRDNWRGQLFERVRLDVERVQSVSFSGGGDQYRLGSVIQELNELQGKLAAGRYDQRELDDVIGALQRVVRDNRMPPRDRDILNDDLNRLADFRARHDSYGAREFGGRDEDAFHRDRNDAFRGQEWRQRFFQRVREDVQHVRAETFPFSTDQYRLVNVIQELDELQGKLSQGRYDERELDDVIGAMGRVVRDNRLSNRDRDALNDDLNRLREFRERHESWGVR